MFENKNTIKPVLKTEETAFQNRLKTYIIKNNMGIKDIQTFLNRLDNPVIGLLKHALKKQNLKVNIMFLAIYKRGTNKKNMEYEEKNFKTRLNITHKFMINVDKSNTTVCIPRELYNELANNL